jgi:hypothetical protein
MSDDGLLSEVRAAILSTYGSLDNPDFHRLRPSLDAPPFAELAADLRRNFTLDDDTDPNTDVARVLILRQGPRSWSISLSLVGPYACILRITRQHRAMTSELVQQPGAAPAEAELFEALSAHGFRMLPRAVLEAPVPLRLWATDPENVRVYQALFSDTDILPWHTFEPPAA